MLCSVCNKRTAVVFVTRIEGDKTINEGLCMVCAKARGIKPIDDIIKKFGISDDELETLEDQFSDMLGNGAEDFEAGGSAILPFMMGENENGGVSNEAETPKRRRTSKKNEKAEDERRRFLNDYCENLTAKAKEGRLDRIIGRDKEIYRTIQILCRRQKNNPCLIGEAGVGKTAIAEGIALRIASGDVPELLSDKEIYLLDLTALVAGTQFRGQFESRVKGLIKEVKQLGNIILFIDEVHTLTGAGDSEGAMNAANILKPALSRGEIQVIGATTFAEYRKYIEKDSALERRFQPVTVEEPSIDDTVAVIKGIKEYYEIHHGVMIGDDVVSLVVMLSERYITDRYLPDKAIDLLDEAAACTALRTPEISAHAKLAKSIMQLNASITQLEQAETIDYETLAKQKSDLMRAESEFAELDEKVRGVYVTPDDVAKVVELWTGIPASRIKSSETTKIALLEENIKKKIIGQDEAVKLVADAIKRSRAGVTLRRRPASFIFVGPTGVGKTELVKVLAGELFDGVEPLIRLDMSEYMEKHAVARLIGSPPGYVGYDEAGQLTEQVRRKPYSVVLFDEIEKAHPDVMNILLQILDEGKVKDAHGRTVNFENTVIAMTSNAGSGDSNGQAGFNKQVGQMSKDKALKSLREFLRPEFMSRVDEVVVFEPLSRESLVEISAFMLDEMKQALSERSIKLSYTREVCEWLADRCENGKYGARDLRRLIRREAETPMANIIVSSPENSLSIAGMGIKDDKIFIDVR